MVSGSPRLRPSATLIGSMSPTRSATLVSGVASFSVYRSLRCRHSTGRSSPSSAARRIDSGVIGCTGARPARSRRSPASTRRAGRSARAAAASCPGRARRAARSRARRSERAPAAAARCPRSRGCPATRRAGGQRGQQVLPDLGLTPRSVAGGTQLADGAGQVGRSSPHDTSGSPQISEPAIFRPWTPAPGGPDPQRGSQVPWRGAFRFVAAQCAARPVGPSTTREEAGMSVQGDPGHGAAWLGSPVEPATAPSPDPWTSALWSRPDTVAGYAPPLPAPTPGVPAASRGSAAAPAAAWRWSPPSSSPPSWPAARRSRAPLRSTDDPAAAAPRPSASALPVRAELTHPAPSPTAPPSTAPSAPPGVVPGAPPERGAAVRRR